MKSSLIALLIAHAACVPAYATESGNNENVGVSPSAFLELSEEEIAELMQELERVKTPQDAIRKHCRPTEVRNYTSEPHNYWTNGL